MSFCINCGQKLAEGSKFCNNCGTKVGTMNVDEPKSTVSTYVEEEKVSQVVPEDITERKNVYEGKIYKCPNCGDSIDAYETICEACGYEIRGRNATNSVRELQLKLEELHAKRPKKKMTNVFAQAFGGGQLSNVDEEIVNLIKNFSIPNTKEDIMEFMILASSNIDLKVYGFNSQQYQMRNPAQREISDAWLAKFEQALQKAKISFGTTAEFQKFQNIYEEKTKEISKTKKKVIYIILSIIGGVILYFVLMFALIGGMGSTENKEIEAENARLNTIVSEVYSAIEDENYTLARAKASDLVFSVHNGYSNEHEEDWKVKRTEILSVIDKAEGIVADTTGKSNAENEQFDEATVSEFVDGYEKAEFEKYNSNASENGLGDTRIYFSGKITKTEILNADGTTSILGYVEDDTNNTWLVQLHFVPAVSETQFDSVIGKPIVLRGVYTGFSGTKKLPVVVLDELLIKETGEKMLGMQKLLDE